MIDCKVNAIEAFNEQQYDFINYASEIVNYPKAILKFYNVKCRYKIFNSIKNDTKI